MNYPNNKIKSDMKAIAEASEFSPHKQRESYINKYGENILDRSPNDSKRGYKNKNSKLETRDFK